MTKKKIVLVCAAILEILSLFGCNRSSDKEASLVPQGVNDSTQQSGISADNPNPSVSPGLQQQPGAVASPSP